MLNTTSSTTTNEKARTITIFNDDGSVSLITKVGDVITSETFYGDDAEQGAFEAEMRFTAENSLIPLYRGFANNCHEIWQIYVDALPEHIDLVFDAGDFWVTWDGELLEVSILIQDVFYKEEYNAWDGNKTLWHKESMHVIEKEVRADFEAKGFTEEEWGLTHPTYIPLGR